MNHSRRFGAVVWTGLFVVFAALLLWAMHETIATPNLETSDFAANSLLVQQAKNFELLTGHYSRVGFYHPGPMVLYMLALGEYVFHDVLHLAPTGFSGQLIMLALYYGFWLAVIGWLIRRVSASWLEAAAGLGAFLLFGALVNRGMFTGMWFPDITILPFGVVILCVGQLIAGDFKSLPVLGLAMAVLISLHASFPAIIGIIFIAGIIASTLLYGWRGGAIGSLLKRDNWLYMGICTVIVILALVPLLILTITQFPGPVGNYLSFSASKTANSWGQAVEYLAVYWGGVGAMVLGLIALALSWSVQRSAGQPKPLQDNAVAILCATLAALVYAKIGVDQLDQAYIEAFYYAAPALAAAELARAAVRFLGGRGTIAAASVLTFSAIATWLVIIHTPPGYAIDYNGSEGTEIYDYMRDNVPAPIAVDLDGSADWGKVWSTVASAQIVMARHDSRAWCVDQGWNVLFTVPFRCTDEESASLPHYLVKPAGSYSEAQAQSWTAGGLQFLQLEPDPQLTDGTVSVRGQIELFPGLLKQGWAMPNPGDDYVWSITNNAELALNLAPDFRGQVALTLGAFVPPGTPSRAMTFTTGGGQSQVVTFDSMDDRQVVSFDSEGPGPMTIGVTFDRPVSPASANLSDDPRELGVSLYKIDLNAAAS